MTESSETGSYEHFSWILLPLHNIFPGGAAVVYGSLGSLILVAGHGLGPLSMAGNPYTTVCGPPRYAEMSIDLS